MVGANGERFSILRAWDKWGRWSIGWQRKGVSVIALLGGAATVNAQVAAPPLAHPPIPRGNPGAWIATADYPVRALSHRVEGATAFRLSIDTEGFVRDCRVTQSSGDDLLDTTTCALIRARGWFQPAANSQGQPIAGEWTNRIQWRLPSSNAGYSAHDTKVTGAGGRANSPVPQSWSNMLPYSAETSFTVQRDGKITDCEQQFVGDRSVGATNVRCATLPRMAPIFTDDQGRPVSKRVRMIQSLTITDMVSGVTLPDKLTQ
ncbi:TonB family protein [Sphingobium fontiphilum]|uniref:TonB family protein n=1 Tax=Sphingobium fontiphilum TaxID=944425 RepID=A0A7W6GMD1_9SPHN|nr:TonB family protein [Sphingobium fontiphilum]